MRRKHVRHHGFSSVLPNRPLVTATVIAICIALTAILIISHSTVFRHISDSNSDIAWSQNLGVGTVFPACGSAVNLIATCSGNTAQLSWGPPDSEGYYYYWQISDNTNGYMSTAYQTNSTSVSVPGLYSSSYSWNVEACDSGGCSSPTFGNVFSCASNGVSSGGGCNPAPPGAPGNGAGYDVLPNGQIQHAEINAAGYDFCVTNNGGYNLFVPAASTMEIGSFYNAVSSGQLGGVSPN